MRASKSRAVVVEEGISSGRRDRVFGNGPACGVSFMGDGGCVRGTVRSLGTPQTTVPYTGRQTKKILKYGCGRMRLITPSDLRRRCGSRCALIETLCDSAGVTSGGKNGAPGGRARWRLPGDPIATWLGVRG